MKTLTPKYRIELSYVDFIAKKRNIASFAWSVQRDGKPNFENAKKFRDGMNDSLKNGGTNEHLRAKQGDYCSAKIINQKTGETVVYFTPSAFELVD